ncbi:hypothetical protein PHPALM_30243 [Phytophthora palmivora]|uniref:Uncharacterized protein n=1 Tax=Phytophthora palmivora TaxID=4796 RepID=A0A2P4X5L4_9STRA|nr:hypothetical protein PHPALM_30243 [Phytophthora palmivora]
MTTTADIPTTVTTDLIATAKAIGIAVSETVTSEDEDSPNSELCSGKAMASGATGTIQHMTKAMEVITSDDVEVK